MIPQGNASTGLGIGRKNRERSTYDVLTGDIPLREAIQPTAVPRLHICPATIDLSGLELEIAQEKDRAFRLRKALAALNAGLGEASYTYVLVDCPPSLNLVTVNAMAAADSILVPLQCEFFALEGLSQLLKTVDQVKSTLNPGLSIHGIVLTMYDARNNLAGQVVADVRGFMGEPCTRPSSRATSGCRRRRHTASQCCSTISNASAARLICASRRRSSSARSACGAAEPQP